jgi:dCTP deaminase
MSDRDILKEIEAGNIICQPFIKENVSNSSLDVRLGKTLKLHQSLNKDHALISFDIDENGKTKAKYTNIMLAEFDLTDSSFILGPNEFVLAETLEYVGSNANHIIAEVADKSTLARAGISVCFSAGYIDCGNSLNITLEIKNNGNVPVKLAYGQHIAQLKFQYLSSPAINSYDGKYKNSTVVEESK